MDRPREFLEVRLHRLSAQAQRAGAVFPAVEIHNLPHRLRAEDPHQRPLDAALERRGRARARSARALQPDRDYAVLDAHHLHVAPVRAKVRPNLLQRGVDVLEGERLELAVRIERRQGHGCRQSP